jgi:glutathione S-transferase
MNQSQRELRRAAAQEFLKSLNELEQMLQQESHPSVRASPAPEDDTFSDMSAIEEAVADIEQYMENNQGNG